MINIFNVNLLDIMPESLKNDPQVQALCGAITPEIQAISNEIPQCILLPRIDDLPGDVVDLLAWHFHVDFYDTALPIEIKRQLVKKSMLWHKRKGTPSAVEELISTLFDEGKVVEWFEYGGQPYYFKVVTNNESVTQERAAEFTKALESVKNKRSWLEKVEITQSEKMNLYLAGVVHVGDFETIRQVI